MLNVLNINKLCFLCAILLLALFFCAPARGAEPDPKGAFGFVWGDSSDTVKQKAGVVRLQPEVSATRNNEILAYSGEVAGYKGLFRFGCRNNKLYNIAVSMSDDAAFKHYDEILADFTKLYGKPAEQRERNGLTVSGWMVGDTTLSVGKFNSTNDKTGETEYITSVLYIQTSVERELKQSKPRR